MLAQVFNPTEIKKNGPATGPAHTPARRNGFAFTAASVVLPTTSHYGDARDSVNGDNRRWLVVASSQRRCPLGRAGAAPVLGCTPRWPSSEGCAESTEPAWEAKDPSPGSLAWPRDLGLPGDHCGSCRVLTISLQIMINLRFSL
jgi:hypothetical protein